MKRPCAICKDKEPTNGLVIGDLKQTGVDTYLLTLDGLNLCPICPQCEKAVGEIIGRFIPVDPNWDIEYEALFKYCGGYFGSLEEDEQQAEVVGGERGA